MSSSVTRRILACVARGPATPQLRSSGAATLRSISLVPYPVRNFSAPSETPSTGPASASGSASSRPSFISRVAAGGADLLLGAFVSTGTRFDRNLEGLTVTELSQGRVVVEFTVNEGLSNAYGTLHGGATATIVDVVTTMALLSQDPMRAGVSVDLNVSYLSAAKVGERVVVEASVLRSGKKLGFTECTLWKVGEDKGDERTMVATGRHTKAL